MSKLTDYFTWEVVFTYTCFNFRLLLLISSIRLPRADPMLTLADGGASSGGGGGGGGIGRLRWVFLLRSSLKSIYSCLIYCCT